MKKKQKTKKKQRGIHVGDLVMCKKADKKLFGQLGIVEQIVDTISDFDKRGNTKDIKEYDVQMENGCHFDFVKEDLMVVDHFTKADKKSLIMGKSDENSLTVHVTKDMRRTSYVNIVTPRGRMITISVDSEDNTFQIREEKYAPEDEEVFHAPQKFSGL